MSAPYARLSDLGEIDLTFDQEDAPVNPKQRKKNAAQITSEEMEMDRRRRKIPVQKSKGRSPYAKKPPLEEMLEEDIPFGDVGPPMGFDPAPSGGAPEPIRWDQLDRDVYGAPPGVPGVVPPFPKKKSVDDYMIYIAIALLVGAGGFFFLKKKSSSGDGGDE